MSREVNMLVFIKGAEKYIFFYTDERRGEILEVLGRLAANPELSFTWWDETVLSQKVRQTVTES